MLQTDGSLANSHGPQGLDGAAPTLFQSEARPTVHEPPIVVRVANIPTSKDPIPDASTELLNNNPISEPRAPPLLPKESKGALYPYYPRSVIGKVRGLGGRDQERQSAKDDSYPSNNRQRIQDQALIINDLEKRLGKRDNHIKDLEGRINQYRRQLQEAEVLRQELSSVRQHLRLGDEDEPWIIKKKFGEINKWVDDISVKFSTALCKAGAHRELDTLDLLEQLLIHQGYEQKASIETPYAIEAEEFIDLGCRSLLNELLMSTVLDVRMFNPEWHSSTNKLFCEMYQTVQNSDAQVNAGRWRISTFKAIPNDVQRYCETHAQKFCERTLVPFCQTAYGTELCSAAKESVFSDIVALLEQAYAWNYRTKSTVLMLDFEAVYYPPGDHFNGVFSELERSRTKSPTPESILLTTHLGLRSHKALGNGKQECVCQTKAVVLGNDYFRG